MITRRTLRRAVVATCPIALLGLGATLLPGMASAQTAAPERPVLVASDCPEGHTLVALPGDPLLVSWEQQINTGVSVGAGRLHITRYWSWDGYEARTGVQQANEQWAVRVGSATSELTADLADMVSSAIATGSLGSIDVAGGEMQVVHSSLVGDTDGSANSVRPIGFCYVLETPTVTTQAPTTEAPTTEAPTTQAPTTEAPTTEAPVTEAPTTLAPTTLAPTTLAPTTVIQHAPTPNPDPVATKPAAALATVATAPAPAPAPTAPAATVAVAAAPTTAPRVVVLAAAPIAPTEEVAEAELSYTGSNSGPMVAIALVLILAGAVMLSIRRNGEAGQA